MSILAAKYEDDGNCILGACSSGFSRDVNVLHGRVHDH